MSRSRHDSFIVALILVTGCGNKELGQKAPVYGSSSALSTTAGFLKGRWKQKFDRSNAAPSQFDYSKFIPEQTLEFKEDHACELSCEGHTVHMAWNEVWDGISLTVKDIDGRDPVQVRAQLQPQLAHPSPFAEVRIAAMKLDMALTSATDITKLVLAPDKKHLIEQRDGRGTSERMFGVPEWVRLES